MDLFNTKYKNIIGKTDSLYIYILYNCHYTEIHEHIKKQQNNIKRIADPYKKKLFSSRYQVFRELIENDIIINETEDFKYNSIIFIGNNDYINIYDLTDTNIFILRKYNHRTITFVNNNYYDLIYLEDLIFNDDPYHIYKFDNNKIEYIHMTRTKRMIVNDKQLKHAADAQNFISATLQLNKHTKYVIINISTKYKLTIPDEHACIIKQHMSDNEIMEMMDKIDQEIILEKFEIDLTMMHNPKYQNRLVFKKDILLKIKNAQLEKLYIEKLLYVKFVDNMKKQGLDINCKIIIIDTKLKSFVENRETKINIYDGVVGVTYY